MLKIGHRGASGTAPENTLEAFRKSLALGADGIELDVHRCKSGELVVIHDDTVDRTTDGQGYVARLTYVELAKLRIQPNETIPLLEDVLAAIKPAYSFIEIKHTDAAMAVAEQIEKCIKIGYPAERLWLISFHHDALKVAVDAYPQLNIGASFERLEPHSITASHAMGARAIIVHHKAMNEIYVNGAHTLGLKILCWTVNEPADISRLKALGVDGIISDYPERL